MRKISNILVIASILSAVIVSCEQIENEPGEINNAPNINLSMKESINNLLVCPDNLEINEFNLKLLDRSNNLVTALSRAEFKDQIISLYDQKPIMAFDSIYSQYKKISSIDRLVTYDGVEYEVGVRFFNFDRCDPNKNPIVCIGTEIPNSDPIYDDNIVGWIIGEDGINQEILVTEEFAENTEHPLFIVVNGVYDEPDNNKSSIRGEKKSAAFKYGLKIYGQKITERYETWADSEYNVSWKIVPEGDTDGFSNPWMGYTFAHIKDIKKDQIINGGDDLTYEFKFYYFDNMVGYIYEFGEYWDTNHLLIGLTYEHDWYASLKTTSIEYETGKSLTIKYRASNSSDYYQKFSFIVGPYNDGNVYSWTSFDQRVLSKGYVDIKSY